MNRRFLSVLCFLAVPGVAEAADVPAKTDLGQGAVLSVSIGHLNGTSHETVYNEDGSKLSELVWDLQNAMTLNGSLVIPLGQRFSLYGNASAALMSDNYMDDYDWLVDPPPADPSDHSWHEDTSLDHYYALDAGAAFALYQQGPNQISLLGGFKYTSVQWTAYGGCFDYSEGSGCFPDGEKGITFRVSLPAVYAGLGYQGTFDRWTVALDGRAGMTVSPASEDDHWMRDLNFFDHLNGEPYIALNGRIGYAVSDRATLFGSVAYDKYYEMRGETTVTDTSTGQSGRSDYDIDGTDLYTLNVALGLDYRL